MQQIDNILVFDGDSISLGVGATHGYTLADQVKHLLHADIAFYVTAVGGRTVKECLRLFDSEVQQIFKPSAFNNVIFFSAGDNDIAWGNNGRDTYNLIKEYIAYAHDQGWHVVVSTKLQRYDWPETARAELNLLNSLVLANSAGADGIADFQGNLIMGSETGRMNHTNYTTDGVHPANAGYTILAEIAATALMNRFEIIIPRQKDADAPTCTEMVFAKVP